MPPRRKLPPLRQKSVQLKKYTPHLLGRGVHTVCFCHCGDSFFKPANSLLVAILASYYYNLSHEASRDNEPWLWYKEQKIESVRNSILAHCHTHQLSPAGPHSLAELTPLLQTLNVQLYCYIRKSRHYKKLWTYPPVPDFSRMPLYLWQCRDDSNEGATYHFIADISLFDCWFAYDCPFCDKSIARHNKLHSCRQGRGLKLCQACQRQKWPHGGFSNVLTQRRFCHAETDYRQHCGNCGLQFFSDICRTYHTKYACNTSFFCQDCRKYYRACHNRTLAELKENHRCFETICRLCHHLIPPFEETSHICNMIPPQPNTYYRNLCFFDFETIETPEGLEPNFVCLLYEKYHRGEFYERYFAASPLRHASDNQEGPAFSMMYLPPEIRFPLFRGNHTNRRFKKPPLDSALMHYDDTTQFYSTFAPPSQSEIRDVDPLYAFEPPPDIECPAEKMILFMHRPAFRNYFFCAHNSAKFDSHLLLEKLVKLNIEVDLIKSGTRLLLIKLPQYNIVVGDSLLYIRCSLASFNLRFPQLKDSKGFFPHHFNKPEFYDYRGKIPDLGYFLSENDSEEAIWKKIEFVTQSEIGGYLFDFKKEIKAYCYMDTYLLASGFLLMYYESFNFEKKLCNFFGAGSEKGLAWRSLITDDITLQSYIYNSFKAKCLDHSKYHAIMDELGVGGPATSRGEIQMCEYLQNYVCSDVEHKFSSHGQRRFGAYHVDAYSPSLKTAFEYNGCVIHGCPHDFCHLLRKDRAPTDTNIFGISYAEMKANFRTKLSFLKQFVARVVVIQACEWEIFSASLYFRKLPPKTLYFPPHRLVPRHALRGGRSETFRAYFDQAAMPAWKLEYVDYNALYPHMQIGPRAFFCQGPYEFIAGEDLNRRIFWNDAKERFEIEAEEQILPLEGCIQASVLCPPHLFIPFLLFRLRAKSLAAACYTCAVKERTTPCSCPENERAITDTWTVPEINFAKKIGYRILKIHEVMLYQNTERTFAKFMKFLAFYRLQSLKFPPHCPDKLEYLRVINEKMDFGEIGLALTLDNVAENKLASTFYKDLQNSTIGKFAQSIRQPLCSYVRDQEALERLFFDASIELKEIALLNPNLALAQYTRELSATKPSLKHNLLHTAYTTAYARIVMMKHMLALENAGGKMCYTDTDSLIVALPTSKNIEELLPMHQVLYGCYKSEVPSDYRISRYVSLGAKNYSYILENEEERLEINKVRGLTLKGAVNRHSISNDLMKTFLDGLKSKTTMRKFVKQFTIRTDRHTFRMKANAIYKMYSNDFTQKRVIPAGYSTPLYNLLPYGYTTELL